MTKYNPSQIEPKWQKKWAEDKLYKFDLDSSKPKYYNLVELPYTSGDLHIGHWFAFTPPDVHARYKRMAGFNVFYPVGFDSFGLPAENAALKRNLHPRDWTLSNVETMQKQFYNLGTMIDWSHRIITCLPEYYKWNQWIFLKMFERDIAYLDSALSNWCPSCQTVLADENVEAGKCWRCGTDVVQKQVEQWFLKITDYAERLLWKEAEGGERSRTINWPKSVREGQNNWIGKSEGMLLKFDDIEVFTTRPDTLFGTTFVVISPEHHLLNEYVISENKVQVTSYINKAQKKSELERKENKAKTGVFTGSYVTNPINGEKIPVWVADYVLSTYGTGAIMAVPAHDQRDFEFAKKFGLEIKKVIEQYTSNVGPKQSASIHIGSEAYEGGGILINSGKYNGLGSGEAKEKISNYLEKHKVGKRQVQYHLHDWSIGRQRYWGTPIPVIHCPKCGAVPVPESDLPVELPYDVDFTPKGKPPLATNEKWLEVDCPKCGGGAQRDAQTLDGFFDNSWYFLRYIDPDFTGGPFNKEQAQKLMPLDIYFGGAEHTLGHTLYARFFTKFLKDIGLLDFEEFALRRVQHGVVLGSDGNRMSKSHGNVINPDDVVKKYGADTVRTYLCFMMPYVDTTGSWNPSAIGGVYNFLQRIWNLQDNIVGAIAEVMLEKDLHIMHKTIKKVTEDIENIKFNTAVATLMEWLNYLGKKDKVSEEEYKTFLLLLAPFAPHITEELWFLDTERSRSARDKQNWSIHQQSWPKFDKKFLEEKEIPVVIQINGKVRDILIVQKDIIDDNKVVENLAKESEKVKKFLDGQAIKKVVYVPGKIINFVTGNYKS